MGVLSEIEAVRHDMKVTQRYLARALGISEKHMSQFLHDKAGASSVRRLDEIARLLGYEWRLVPIGTVPADRIAEIRDAYLEAAGEVSETPETRRIFLFGMRYVMAILDMPEAKVP